MAMADDKFGSMLADLIDATLQDLNKVRRACIVTMISPEKMTII